MEKVDRRTQVLRRSLDTTLFPKIKQKGPCKGCGWSNGITRGQNSSTGLINCERVKGIRSESTNDFRHKLISLKKCISHDDFHEALICMVCQSFVQLKALCNYHLMAFNFILFLCVPQGTF